MVDIDKGDIPPFLRNNITNNKKLKVKIQKWIQEPNIRNINTAKGGENWVKVDNGEGYFHEWGITYDTTEYGPGMYSTAIIEREDGSIEMPPADMIQFLHDATK